MLTGEPDPVRKRAGVALSSGTTNGSGSLLMRAERVGGDTLLSQIVQLVASAQRSRAPVQRLADRISAWFVPAATSDSSDASSTLMIASSLPANAGRVVEADDSVLVGPIVSTELASLLCVTNA